VTSAIDADGAPLFMWRHVFEPNERDHALARLKPDGTVESVQRYLRPLEGRWLPASWAIAGGR
jgi:hypothetical protein